MQDLFAVLTPGDEEWLLAQAVDPERIPVHVAVIMDGNGRWARKRNLPRVAGHKAGIEPVRTVVETCARLGIEYLTLYAFSVENWKRPRTEVETLWRLLRYYLKVEIPRLGRNNIRLNVIGRVDSLPPAAQEDLEAAIAETAGNTGLAVNLAINYGGRAELVDAMNRAIENARRLGNLNDLQLDEDTIGANLYTAGQPDPDLLIRTSGEMRVSNFLLWQIAYAELYVTETLWPDFKRADLLRAVIEYQKRDRRFGGLTTARKRKAEEALAEPLGVSSR
ncbi:MAG: isoprenyl transferase [Bryobacterales bacterium]|nr:isoprenyl transferase [Bryobacterales bacterium]